MTGVAPKKIAELNAELKNALITAIILTKATPKTFLVRDSPEFRGVMSFTLRDSKRHIINCKVWGTKELVVEYNRKFKIYDIIDVISPSVVPTLVHDKSTLADNARFQPLPTVPFSLVLNEGQGRLDTNNYRVIDAFHELHNLRRVPHKALCSALKLQDVRSVVKESSAKEQYVDLLVLVAAQRPVKEVRSKRSGEMLSCLELIVIDSSYSDGVMLSIWQADWILRAQQYWEGMHTVLHLIEVKLAFSDFYKSTTLTFSGRTLVYENPIGAEVDAVMQFAATITTKPWDSLAYTMNSQVDAAEIKTRMTVKQLYARAEGELKDDKEQFTAVVYAMLTHFDFDGIGQIIARRCKSCHSLLTRNQNECDAPKCQLEFSLNHDGAQYESFFNINVKFSDHTGTLVEARLSGAIAERVLALTPNEYQTLSEHEKAQCKWKFLMDYFEVKLLVRKVSAVRRQMSVIVVDMRIIQIPELAEKICVY
ncbi:PREDICTED: protein hold'em [Bactrocera latifrons]|uniref:protein hold'em n=1 Tax=Bactrocera latifrons TaxID=174628 RepID=UPI0008DE8F08|nr:PREDICTED: protein hold'em [Bactrocera latifrons]